MIFYDYIMRIGDRLGYPLPPLEEVVSSPLDGLLAGYDDLSIGGEAAALLQELPYENVRLIHRYTFEGINSVAAHVRNVRELLEGLDIHDPARKSDIACELAQQEIAGAKGFLELVLTRPKLPLVVTLMQAGKHPTVDMAPMGWWAVDTTQDRRDARRYGTTLGVMASYLADPVAYREAYAAAPLPSLDVA